MNDPQSNTQLDNTKYGAFKLKSSFFPLSIFHLINPDIQKIKAQLDNITQQAPNLLKNAPLIIDLDILDPKCEIPNFDILNSLLKSYGLIHIGVRHTNEEQAKTAIYGGLAVLPSLSPEKPKSNNKSNKTTETKVITSPVRSGQQIYAKNSDLIILNSVSPGAEVLADGHIHVYGSLRGRALAGVSGNKNARIFCQTLEAELVSIAGCYMLNEDINVPQNTQTMQIYLLDGHLRISSLA